MKNISMENVRVMVTKQQSCDRQVLLLLMWQAGTSESQPRKDALTK